MRQQDCTCQGQVAQQNWCVQLRNHEGAALSDACKPCEEGCTPGIFRLLSAPSRLPSSYLADLHTQGYTVVDGILHADTIDHVRDVFSRVRTERFSKERSHDGVFWMMDMLKESPAIGAAACHPVVMWLLEQYMGVKQLHFCHQPIASTLRPAKKLLGKRPEGGWHSDYPYRPDRFMEGKWPADIKLGVQYNLCVDEFRPDNGATQVAPGSHIFGRYPSQEWNQGGTRMGKGTHQDVIQFEAPAGAGIIYDSRMWHRACPELNVSGKDRLAILHAVAPDWVVPMLDQSVEFENFLKSPVPPMLTERERRDIEQFCCTRVNGKLITTQWEGATSKL